ncbi:MAG: DsbC family protein [Nitrospirota bacterium]
MQNFLFITGFFIAILLTNCNASNTTVCKQDCTKCHQITDTEILNLLKEEIPNARILEVRPAPVKGMWESAIETNGRKGIVYVDFSKKYVITGNIFDIKTKTNLTGERLYALNKIDLSQIPLNNALVMGEKNATKKVIIFTDPECPFCGKLHQELRKVLDKRKDITFYIKLYPLKMHPNAYDKSITIVCEKSLKLLEDSFERKNLPALKCSTSEVDKNIEIAEKLGIMGTPAIILPDGGIIRGAIDADSLIALIDKAS